jgi:hypothetical protein
MGADEARPATDKERAHTGRSCWAPVAAGHTVEAVDFIERDGSRAPVSPDSLARRDNVMKPESYVQVETAAAAFSVTSQNNIAVVLIFKMSLAL